MFSIRLPPDELAKVSRYVRIQDKAGVLFTNARAILEWMNMPANALDGNRPIDLLDTEAGAARVEALIEGIAHGHAL